MIRYKIFLPLLLLLPGIISCKKFLDINKQSQLFPITSAEDCQRVLDAYDEMNTEYPSDAITSADDYYLAESDFDWQETGTKEIYTWASNASRLLASPQWQRPYKIIYKANLVIKELKGVKDASQTTVDAIRGAALFYRAYNFWQLVQLYTKPYNAATAQQDLGLPLRMNSDINEKVSRATLQQTYDQIKQDLLEAISVIPDTALVASRPSKASAHALLARLFLSMEDYSTALTHANASLQLKNQLINFNQLDEFSDSPFKRFNKEVLFHSVTTYSASELAPYTAKVDADLANSYDPNDLRKTILMKDNGDGTYRFTGNYEQDAYNNLFNGLTTDEMYLTRAECYARTGNKDAAMTDLNTLLFSRWRTGLFVNLTAATADNALSKILEERRKELLFRGMRWTDLRRLNKDPRFAVTLIRTVGATTYTLPPNDIRYTLLIPKEVIELSEGVVTQNPR